MTSIPLTKTMRAWASALVISVCCFACERESQAPSTINDQSEVIEQRDSVVLERPFDCKDPVSECSTVEIHFPVFTHGNTSGNPILPYTLNRAVRNFFVDVLGGTMVPPKAASDTTSAMPNIVDAARLLLGDYEEFKDKYPASGITWSVRGECKLLVADTLVCVELFADAFTGGAHGNTTTGYAIANSKSGRPVQVTDFIKNIALFTDSAERAFRMQLHIPPNEELSDHNYFIESNAFSLPENMGITADSVILYYNTYEIAPYAMGPTRITMPRSALTIH